MGQSKGGVYLQLSWFGIDAESVGDLDGFVAALVQASMTPPCRWTAGLDAEWLEGAELVVRAGRLSLSLGGIEVTAILRSHVSPATLERLASLVEAGEEPIAPAQIWWACVEAVRENFEPAPEFEEPGEVVVFG
jgi:hypothetical protein